MIMKHVIIGAGAAGISAAKTIRQVSHEDEIVVVVTNERRKTVRQPSGDDFFAKNSIRGISGRAVTGIDMRNRLLLLEDGMEYFDNLLITADVEPLFAKSATNVYDLRQLQIVDLMCSHARNAKNIVIIGAGAEGLDIAYALLDIGKTPVIVDMSNFILSKNLDRAAADLYKARFEDAGCTFELGCKITTAEHDDSGNVVSVTLDSGKKLDCDMVIVAGNYCRQSVDFLSDSGIGSDNGIEVDEYCSTGVNGIYAAGNVTGAPDLYAVKQGAVAAKNMCGIPVICNDTPEGNINYFNIPTLSLGQIEPNEGDIVKERQTKNTYEKVILRDDVVVGVILQGCTFHSVFWQFLIGSELNVSRINKPVFDLSFADFYSMQIDDDYRLAM